MGNNGTRLCQVSKNGSVPRGFAAHVGKRPGDQLASFHLKRLLNGASGARIVME
jgi:adenylate cyclase